MSHLARSLSLMNTILRETSLALTYTKQNATAYMYAFGARILPMKSTARN